MEIGGMTARLFHCSGSWPACTADVAKCGNGTNSASMSCCCCRIADIDNAVLRCRTQVCRCFVETSRTMACTVACCFDWEKADAAAAANADAVFANIDLYRLKYSAWDSHRPDEATTFVTTFGLSNEIVTIWLRPLWSLTGIMRWLAAYPPRGATVEIALKPVTLCLHAFDEIRDMN